MLNAVRILHVPNVQVEPVILTGPARTQLTAATPTLTVLILMGCATCPHLTHRITVLTVTMDSVQEVSAWREKQILNTLSLGCSDLGDDSTNCPSTHPNCNGGHVCEPPLDECQVDYDCNEALGLSGICEPGVPEQTQCWYCESDGGKTICKPGI